MMGLLRSKLSILTASLECKLAIIFAGRTLIYGETKDIVLLEFLDTRGGITKESLHRLAEIGFLVIMET